MLDPITSLLAACTNCNQPGVNLDRPTIAVCDGSRKASQDQPFQTGLSLACVSPPETTPESATLVSWSNSASTQPAPRGVSSTPSSTSSQNPPDPAAGSSETPVLQLNSQGQAVSRLQGQLQRLGYYTGAIDGIYGQQTKAAVARFQRSQGLAADGVMGANTWDTLQSVLQPFAWQSSPKTSAAQTSPAETSSAQRPSADTSSTVSARSENRRSTPQSSTLPESSASPENSRPIPQLSQTAAVAETQAPSPSDADSAALDTASQPSFHYLWILGWVIVYGCGWFFILKDTVKEIKGFRFVVVTNPKPQAKESAKPAMARANKSSKTTEGVPKIIIHQAGDASRSVVSTPDAAIDSQPVETAVAVMQRTAKAQKIIEDDESTNQIVNRSSTEHQNEDESDSAQIEQWVLYDPWSDEITDAQSEELEVILADNGQIQPLQNVFIVAPRPTNYSKPRVRKPTLIYGTQSIQQRMKTG